MLLTSTSAKYEVLLAAAITTNQWNVVSTWSDNTTTTYTPGITSTTTNSTTAVSLVPSPAASTQRIVRDVHIFNKDTEPGTITVRYFDGSTNFNILVVTIYPNDTLIWSPKRGWYVIDSRGIIRTNPGTPNQVAEVRLASGQNGTAGANKTLTSTTTYAVYMGRAPQTFSRVLVRFEVVTAATGITWAECALASGQLDLAANTSLTTLRAEPIDTIIDVANVKKMNFVYNGFAGQDLWFLLGHQATGAVVVTSYLQDITQAGMFQAATARPSTMAANTAFTLEATTATAPYITWQLD